MRRLSSTRHAVRRGLGSICGGLGSICGGLGSICGGLGWRRLRARLGGRLRSESGNAALEFLLLGVTMIVPLVYLVITIMNVQLAAYAAEAVGRNLARAYTLESPATLESSAALNAGVIVETLLKDYGFEPEQLSYEAACVPACQPGADYVVRVRLNLGLPLLPDFLNPRQALSVLSEVSMPISKYQS